MSALMTPARRRAAIHGLLLGGLLLSILELFSGAPFGFDAFAYWSVSLDDLYRRPVGEFGLFPYAPPVALLADPLGFLPWPVYVVAWWSLLGATLIWLAARDWRAVIVFAAFPPLVMELVTGNIHLLLAAAMVLGFRYPAVWALILLTKVTPGVALLWFAFRREWGRLALALGATAAIVLVSAVLLPQLWIDWLAFLAWNAPHTPFGFPVWLRLPVAVAIVWWGARRDAYWTVPVAATVALPVLWLAGLAMLVACWPLSGDRRRYYVPDARPGDAAVSAQAAPDAHPAGLQRGATDRAGAG